MGNENRWSGWGERVASAVGGRLSALDSLEWTATTEAERWLAAFLVVTLGVLSLSTHALYAVRTDPSLAAFVMGPLVQLLLSVVVLGAVAWLLGNDYGEYLPRIAVWSAGGAVVLVAIGQQSVVYASAVDGGLATSLSTLAYMVTTGTAMGLVVGVYDAGLRRTREDLDDQRKRAELYSQQLSVLNRILRHDVRTGVQIIRSYAEMLPEPRDVSPRVPVEKIRERADEMAETAESARQVEHMLRDGDEWTDRIDAAVAVESAVETVRRRYPDARVRSTVPGEAHVVASTVLELAVEELLTNAVEHAEVPPDEVGVGVECVAESSAVVVRITDDGPGIPDEELEPLGQGQETQLTHTSGVGLWLATWIVEGGDGTLTFEDREGGGTRATIRLPR